MKCLMQGKEYKFEHVYLADYRKNIIGCYATHANMVAAFSNPNLVDFYCELDDCWRLEIHPDVMLSVYE